MGKQPRVLPQPCLVEVEVPEVSALVHSLAVELRAPHADDDLLQQHRELEAPLKQVLLLSTQGLVRRPEGLHDLGLRGLGLPRRSGVLGWRVEAHLEQGGDGVHHVRGGYAGVPVFPLERSKLKVHEAKLRGALLELGAELLLQLRGHVGPVLLALGQREPHLRQHQLDLFPSRLLPSSKPGRDVGRVEQGIREAPVLQHDQVAVLLVLDPLGAEVGAVLVALRGPGLLGALSDPPLVLNHGPHVILVGGPLVHVVVGERHDGAPQATDVVLVQVRGEVVRDAPSRLGKRRPSVVVFPDPLPQTFPPLPQLPPLPLPASRPIALLVLLNL
mmetsp:Transcript_10721/g.37084  ORF Transcript_10721/g.37084 Transcript_10721/m.37084 type:complete len:330 (-) Transcript_10721:605-1594(-)